MKPGALSEGTIAQLELSSPSDETVNATRGGGALMAMPQSATPSLSKLSFPGRTLRLQDEASGLCVQEAAGPALRFAPCEMQQQRTAAHLRLRRPWPFSRRRFRRSLTARPQRDNGRE